MNILGWLRVYLVTLIVFAAIDAVWITLVAQLQYRSAIPALLAEKMDLGAAIAFYLLYVLGIVYFAIRPLYHSARLKQTLVNAALYGFFTYSTWALTLKAVAVGVPWSVVLTDIVWGAVLCMVVVSTTTFLLPDTRYLIMSRKETQ